VSTAERIGAASEPIEPPPARYSPPPRISVPAAWLMAPSATSTTRSSPPASVTSAATCSAPVAESRTSPRPPAVIGERIDRSPAVLRTTWLPVLVMPDTFWNWPTLTGPCRSRLTSPAKVDSAAMVAATTVASMPPWALKVTVVPRIRFPPAPAVVSLMASEPGVVSRLPVTSERLPEPPRERSRGPTTEMLPARLGSPTMIACVPAVEMRLSSTLVSPKEDPTRSAAESPTWISRAALLGYSRTFAAPEAIAPPERAIRSATIETSPPEVRMFPPSCVNWFPGPSTVIVIVFPAVLPALISRAAMFPPAAAEISIFPFAAVTEAKVKVPVPVPASVDCIVTSPGPVEAIDVTATPPASGSKRFRFTPPAALLADATVPTSRSRAPPERPIPEVAERLTAAGVMTSAALSDESSLI